MSPFSLLTVSVGDMVGSSRSYRVISNIKDPIEKEGPYCSTCLRSSDQYKLTCQGHLANTLNFLCVWGTGQKWLKKLSS